MAENVKVIVRCRPMNEKEKNMNCKCVIKMKDCVVEIFDPNEGPMNLGKQFTFDSVYDQESHTEQIYNEICYPLVESVLEGYNATIFVYGQTGCGKSYTMEGYDKRNHADKGVIPRTFEHIFETIAVTTGVKYLALISYLEIYNEQIRDLLVPNTNDKLSNDNSNLALKEVANEGVTVPGLSSHPVQSASECEYYLNLGTKNRIVGSTLMNQNSSRSHSIFIISIEQIGNIGDNEHIKKGKLNLVDLAGSERQTKTGASGDRLKEATKINLSLSALGNVISALVDGKAKHIPYRDSKLTRLLQDSLGGNTRTLMIACIGPASRDYAETLSTLRYANRAKNIHNRPKVNEDPKEAILREYKAEIERLKDLLVNYKTVRGDGGDALLEPIRESETEPDEAVPVEDDAKDENDNERSFFKEPFRIVHAEPEPFQALPSKDEILQRIEEIKKSMIGGEKADDAELSERRRKKKVIAERRASAIAHLLAKINKDEDRETLQNQYKDISEELNQKTEILRRYRYKVRSLEKEIKDIYSEFEQERQDYLETIRKLNMSKKLMTQIGEKLAGTLKKECNYSDLEEVKRQSVWVEESQSFKLPEVLVAKVRLPTPGNNIAKEAPGRLHDVQTAPGRLQCDSELQGIDMDIFKTKLEMKKPEDLINKYFQPATKRVNELLRQSTKIDAKHVLNVWKDYADRKKKSAIKQGVSDNGKYYLPDDLKVSSTTSTNGRRPQRLEALPQRVRLKNFETTVDFNDI